MADFAFWDVPFHAIYEAVELIGIFLPEDFFEEIDDFEPFVDKLFFVERNAAAEMMSSELDDGRELVASVAEEQFFERLYFVVLIHLQLVLALYLCFGWFGIVDGGSDVAEFLLVLVFVLCCVSSVLIKVSDSILLFGSKSWLLDLFEQIQRLALLFLDCPHTDSLESWGVIVAWWIFSR